MREYGISKPFTTLLITVSVKVWNKLVFQMTRDSERQTLLL